MSTHTVRTLGIHDRNNSRTPQQNTIQFWRYFCKISRPSSKTRLRPLNSLDTRVGPSCSTSLSLSSFAERRDRETLHRDASKWHHKSVALHSLHPYFWSKKSDKIWVFPKTQTGVYIGSPGLLVRPRFRIGFENSGLIPSHMLRYVAL